MNNIKIKIKDKEPSDESILARKNFSAVTDQYKTIKSSYAKVASLWGATIGMTVFLAFAATETLGTRSNDNIQQAKAQEGSTPPMKPEKELIQEITSMEKVQVEDKIASSSEAQSIEAVNSVNVQTSKKTKIDEQPETLVNRDAIENQEIISNLKSETKDTEPEEIQKINIRYVPE
ncbi:MAG: hypothetical protein ACJAZ2_001597 [Glaciecola sp.]|jgi:hypothetical protein